MGQLYKHETSQKASMGCREADWWTFETETATQPKEAVQQFSIS
jgi:hypothetical protein